MPTSENLAAAFAGESQANRKYLAFAKKADADGFPQIAKLFRAAAEAETVHAHAHFRAMGGVKNTEENLNAAIAGEGYEFREMYPPFLAEAEKEAHKAATLSFKYALAVEKTHHDLYVNALEAFKSGKDMVTDTIWVCPICGHTQVGGAPEKCPVCGVSKDRFFEVK
jgi:rubrerythrin